MRRTATQEIECIKINITKLKNLDKLKIYAKTTLSRYQFNKKRFIKFELFFRSSKRSWFSRAFVERNQSVSIDGATLEDQEGTGNGNGLNDSNLNSYD